MVNERVAYLHQNRSSEVDQNCQTGRECWPVRLIQVRNVVHGGRNFNRFGDLEQNGVLSDLSLVLIHSGFFANRESDSAAEIIQISATRANLPPPHRVLRDSLACRVFFSASSGRPRV